MVTQVRVFDLTELVPLPSDPRNTEKVLPGDCSREWGPSGPVIVCTVDDGQIIDKVLFPSNGAAYYFALGMKYRDGEAIV